MKKKIRVKNKTSTFGVFPYIDPSPHRINRSSEIFFAILQTVEVFASNYLRYLTLAAYFKRIILGTRVAYIDIPQLGPILPRWHLTHAHTNSIARSHEAEPCESDTLEFNGNLIQTSYIFSAHFT